MFDITKEICKLLGSNTQLDEVDSIVAEFTIVDDPEKLTELQWCMIMTKVCHCLGIDKSKCAKYTEELIARYFGNVNFYDILQELIWKYDNFKKNIMSSKITLDNSKCQREKPLENPQTKEPKPVKKTARIVKTPLKKKNEKVMDDKVQKVLEQMTDTKTKILYKTDPKNTMRAMMAEMIKPMVLTRPEAKPNLENPMMAKSSSEKSKTRFCNDAVKKDSKPNLENPMMTKSSPIQPKDNKDKSKGSNDNKSGDCIITGLITPVQGKTNITNQNFGDGDQVMIDPIKTMQESEIHDPIKTMQANPVQQAKPCYDTSIDDYLQNFDPKMFDLEDINFDPNFVLEDMDQDGFCLQQTL